MTEPTLELDALEKLALAAKAAMDDHGPRRLEQVHTIQAFGKVANPDKVLALIRALRDARAALVQVCEWKLVWPSDEVSKLRDRDRQWNYGFQAGWDAYQKCVCDRVAALASVPGVAQEGGQ